MARGSALVSAPPPRPPIIRLRSSNLSDSVTDLLSANGQIVRYLGALIVWLQQMFKGITDGLFDKMPTWEPLVGLRNGTNARFSIGAGTVRTGLNGNPQALLLQGSTPLLYTASQTPAAGEWTLIYDASLRQQFFVLGTPPTGVPADEPIVAFVVVQ